ncbi:D-tyrosyl-tRNA(Tyr) deacylase [Malaciobacter marinus]|jgi:D-tyrosyl-tRNA(Tyr) deacylase|uniref:D-aminoacyl-tRNA deacylase n=1 Tax=Malaciobacter marinus TaxID=505249 RepID=A0AB36ZVN3_9BACT|nr:D-aminoacyl-tRNA deacylase [Malaciobacter marinus]PPK60562.1 D-tyrosyl-tRNA(Tyr) deacylase [Malaciobacter marinus]
MIAVIQRVNSSSVTVDNEVVGKISKGLNILLGVKKGDRKEDITKLVNKIVNLRIFQDENDKMNLSLLDIKGEALIISQFTLAANVKKGRRPSFDSSEKPDIAKDMYKQFVKEFEFLGVHTQTGIFGEHMDVNIQNDGPVTFIVDSNELN